MQFEPSRFRRLAREVHRRSLWQVLGIYLAASWAVLQVVDPLVDRLALPEWTYGVALLLLLVGLPVVLAVAVVQEGAPHRDGEPPRPGGAPPAPDPARRTARWLTWRNAGVGGVVALAAWGLLAAGWIVAGPGPRGEPVSSASATRLAVMPFAVRGSGEYDYLREGMVDLLSTKLDGAGDLRTVDSHALLSAMDPAPVNLAPSEARALAERFGAGLVVLGNVVEASDRLRLNATLYDFTRDGAGWEAAAEGEAGQLFELVDSVAAKILAGLARGPGARAGRIAAMTTASLPALKAYLQGDAAFREGHFDESYDAFTRAVEEDSLFALAHYRRSIASEWTTRFEIALIAAQAALRHSARLSDRDRRQLEAFLAYRRGAFHEAERLYRAIVGVYPDDVEAWNHLGETLFHYAPLHARSRHESRAAFERVLSYDTFRGAAIVHLARLAAAAERRTDLDSLVATFLETNPEGDREIELLVMQAWASDDAELRRRVLERMAGADDQILAFALWDLATYLHRPDGVRDVAALLTGPENPAEVRVYGHAMQAYALLALGRWREARDQLDAAARIDPAMALEHRALLTLFPPVRAARAELAGLRDALRRLDPDRVPPSRNPRGFFSVHDGLHSFIVPYLLGMVHARLGEAADARRLADSLEAMPGPLGIGSAPADFAWTIRAEVHRAGGRTAEALAAIDRVAMEGWYSQMLPSPFLARAHPRFLRAELLVDAGRGADALPWYETLVDATPSELMYLGMHHLRQAQILAGLGQDDDAAHHLRRVDRLWTGADPEFRALLEQERPREVLAHRAP